MGGLYLEDCQEAAPWSADKPYSGYMPYARSLESADRLWELSFDWVSGQQQRQNRRAAQVRVRVVQAQFQDQRQAGQLQQRDA